MFNAINRVAGCFSIPMLIVVECEDRSAIQAHQSFSNDKFGGFLETSDPNTSVLIESLQLILTSVNMDVIRLMIASDHEIINLKKK